MASADGRIEAWMDALREFGVRLLAARVCLSLNVLCGDTGSALAGHGKSSVAILIAILAVVGGMASAPNRREAFGYAVAFGVIPFLNASSCEVASLQYKVEFATSIVDTISVLFILAYSGSIAWAHLRRR